MAGSKGSRSDFSQRFIDAIERVSDGYALFDADDRLIYCNHTWRYRVNDEVADIVVPGVRFEQVMRANLTRSRDLVTEAVGREDEWLAERMARHRGPFQGAFEQRCRDDQHLLVRDYPTAEGGRVVIASDVTELKRSEQRIREQQLQLIQANKLAALGTLVSGVAHEINNPNNLILTNTELLGAAWNDALRLLDAVVDDPHTTTLGGLPYAEMREIVPELIADSADAARRIARIVADLKDFARPGDRTRREPVDLNRVVERAAALLAARIRRATRQFTLDLAGGLPTLQGDAQRLEQVVINLLVNALEALPDGDRGVTVRTVRDGERIELRVADQGIGIPEAQRGQVFDPFFTTKQGRGGTGLGLAISHTLVREHGGRIGIESTPGQGTTVTVSLPLRAAPRR